MWPYRQTNGQRDATKLTVAFCKFYKKCLNICACTIEDVTQRQNLKNICYFSVQNLFRILLPEAIISKALKIIILYVPVHECKILFVPVHECKILFLLVLWRN
jgi:hypothetical protein